MFQFDKNYFLAKLLWHEYVSLVYDKWLLDGLVGIEMAHVKSLLKEGRKQDWLIDLL